MGKKEPTPKELRDGLLVAFLPSIIASFVLSLVGYLVRIDRAPWLFLLSAITAFVASIWCLIRILYLQIRFSDYYQRYHNTLKRRD